MELRRTHFPYCLKRTSDNRYIILNRDYKPLGIQTDDWVNYETDPSAADFKITAATAKKLSWEEREDLETIYLYHDGSVPTDSAAHMTAYLKRLAVLMKLKKKAAR